MILALFILSVEITFFLIVAWHNLNHSSRSQPNSERLPWLVLSHPTLSHTLDSLASCFICFLVALHAPTLAHLSLYYNQLFCLFVCSIIQWYINVCGYIFVSYLWESIKAKKMRKAVTEARGRWEVFFSYGGVYSNGLTCYKCRITQLYICLVTQGIRNNTLSIHLPKILDTYLFTKF